MKVLVCGGRDYQDRDHVFLQMDRLHVLYHFTEVIHGGASGADNLADEWAVSRGIHQSVFKADWKEYGNAAGPIRNQEMLMMGHPDMVVAFPGGKGTQNMKLQAMGMRVPIYDV